MDRNTLIFTGAIGLLLLGSWDEAHAQSSLFVPPAQVVATCGSATLATGRAGPLTVLPTGEACLSGTITATLSGSSVTLSTGSNSVGTVGLNTGTNSVGTVGLNSGSNTIGAVSSVTASATGKGAAMTTGGTSQTLIASNVARKAFIVQNPCTAAEQGIVTAENLYINLTTASTTNSSANLAVLAPCSSFEMGIGAGVVSTEAVTVNAATTAHVILSKEF